MLKVINSILWPCIVAVATAVLIAAVPLELLFAVAAALTIAYIVGEVLKEVWKSLREYAKRH